MSKAPVTRIKSVTNILTNISKSSRLHKFVKYQRKELLAILEKPAQMFMATTTQCNLPTVIPEPTVFKC